MSDEKKDYRISNAGMVYQKATGGKMTCPACGVAVDFLVGETTQDGGKQGCERCWRPPMSKPVTPARIEESSGNILQDFNKQYPKVGFKPTDEFTKTAGKDSAAFVNLKQSLKGGKNS